MTAEPVARYRASYLDEIGSASLYRALAQREVDPRLREVYTRLAAVEDRHADFWAAKLRDAGHAVPAPRAPWRARLLGSLARVFGAQFVLPTLSAREAADSGEYAARAEAKGTGLAGEERSHARLLEVLAGGRQPGASGSAIALLEGRHRAVGGNALRAAVLGANDGLVSNLSLIMGVAGAQVSGAGILITGLAGLLAGAGSMAMGEWLSVQSSRELYQRQIDIERAEIETAPEEEAEELALIYQAKGLDEAQAQALSRRILSDESTALDTLAREELGIDPRELGGSAWEAAGASFILFAIGAIVPLAPFLFLHGTTAIAVSLAASAVVLFLIGAGITLLTGRSVMASGVRQLLIGLGAAALTFGVGRLIGASLG